MLFELEFFSFHEELYKFLNDFIRLTFELKPLDEFQTVHAKNNYLPFLLIYFYLAHQSQANGGAANKAIKAGSETTRL